MTTEYIDSQKYMKRKFDEELTKDEKKMLESGQLKLAFYGGGDFLYYKVIKK